MVVLVVLVMSLVLFYVPLAAQVGCFYESQRFSSIFNALQYDLILLTGDYPLIDFTLLGRYINFVQVKFTRCWRHSTSCRVLLLFMLNTWRIHDVICKGEGKIQQSSEHIYR